MILAVSSKMRLWYDWIAGFTKTTVTNKKIKKINKQVHVTGTW